jgi:hypothetical protein
LPCRPTCPPSSTDWCWCCPKFVLSKPRSIVRQGRKPLLKPFLTTVSCVQSYKFKSKKGRSLPCDASGALAASCARRVNSRAPASSVATCRELTRKTPGVHALFPFSFHLLISFHEKRCFAKIGSGQTRVVYIHTENERNRLSSRFFGRFFSCFLVCVPAGGTAVFPGR